MKEEFANHTPDTAPLATGERCSGVTRKGKACPWKPEEGSSWCWRHDESKAAERAQRLSELGRAGKAKQTENKAAMFKEIKLSTTKQIQEALTESLNAVRNSSADVIAKSNAVARLSSVALDIIKTRDIEKEVEELRDLVEQRLKGGPR